MSRSWGHEASGTCPPGATLGATLRAKAVGVGDYRGEIEGEEIGPVEEGKEAKPALSRLEGPEDLRLEEALESAEETLRKLQAEPRGDRGVDSGRGAGAPVGVAVEAGGDV